jgi:hypothetical protein
MPPAAPVMAPQVDINSLLGSLQGPPAAPPSHAPAPAYGYMSHMTGAPGLPGASGADTAAQVQNIMDSLAKHR